MTENPGSPDENAGSDETTVLDRSDLDDHAGGVDLAKQPDPAGTSRFGGNGGDGATAWNPSEDEETRITPAVGRGSDERAETVVRPAYGSAPVAAVAPVTPVPSVEPVAADAPVPPGRSRPRRLQRGEDAVVFPAHRPWTMVFAGILALLWGVEAVFELAFNWSRVRGVPNPPGRYSLAYVTIGHSSTAVAHYIAQIALNKHFVAARAFDLRLALGCFAVIWLIVGLLLLLARGSGIRLGLVWCGLLALPAFGLARGGIDLHGWGLHHLTGAALTGAFAAPLILTALIAVLTGTRRARLFSGRPAEPEFVDVNDPGDVWRS